MFPPVEDGRDVLRLNPMEKKVFLRNVSATPTAFSGFIERDTGTR